MVSSVTFGHSDGMVSAGCSECTWTATSSGTKANAFDMWMDHDCAETGRPGALVGIDPSLTATGVVVIDGALRASTVKSKPLPKGLRDVHAHSARIERTAAAIAEIVPEGSMVAVEGPAIGARFGNPDERAGLRWSLIARLRHRDCLVVQVPPASAKMWLTDNGSAGKDQMIAAAREYAPDASDIKTEHEADAFALVAMLGAWVGRPVTPVPPRAKKSLEGVSWDPIEGELP